MRASRGSLDISYCHPENICPMGTWVPDSFSYHSNEDDVILPGLVEVTLSSAPDGETVETAAAAAAAAAEGGEGKVWTSQFLGLNNPRPKKAADASKQQQQQKAQSKPESRR
jgi:hypothetical protein